MDRIDTTKIDHLFFDLDHTLWDYERNSAETMRELFERYHPSMDREITFTEFIATYDAHNTRLWQRYRENKIDSVTLRRIRWHITFRELQVSIGKWVDQMGLDYIESCPRKPYLMPHTEEVLTALSARFPMHIITNGFQDVQEIKMNSSGLQRFFKHMSTPDTAQVKKPDPRIFRHALDAVGADASRSLYIGDNYQADVLGAQNAGLPVIYYNSRERENPDDVPEIRDLRQLSEFLL